MEILKEVTQQTEKDLLIVFADLSNYTYISGQQTSMETFNFISHICEMTAHAVESAEGTIIKFIGDASLSVFSETNINTGIVALFELKKTIDHFMKQNNINSQLKVSCHFGRVTMGYIGSKSDKRLDIIGNEVNICAMIHSNGFAISEAAFNKLDAQTQKLFKMQSSAVIYVPVGEQY